MNLTQLNAISPLDGRYRGKVSQLSQYFSEEALIKYRVLVEIEYFIALCEIPLPQLSDFNTDLFTDLRKIYKEFNAEDAQKIKDIEKVTNHDVKACEIFLRERTQMRDVNMLHFALTSEDVNNLARSLTSSVERFKL